MSAASHSSAPTINTRWMWLALWLGAVLLMFNLSRQSPYGMEIGDGFTISQVSRSLLDLKVPKGETSQGEFCWVLSHRYVLVEDVLSHSAPISGKVYGTFSDGYFVASHSSRVIIDPDPSVELFKDVTTWMTRVASITGSNDIELITPDRKQSKNFRRTQYWITGIGIVGFIVVLLLTRKKAKRRDTSSL